MELNENIPVRGTYGYVDYRKKNQLIKALAVGAIMGILILIGYLIFGNIKNYLMIPTMLLVIPFANFLVVFFAVLPFRTAPKELYTELKNFADADMLMSDLIVVDEKGARYFCEFAVVYAGGVFAYSSNGKWRPEKVEIPINEKLSKRGITGRIKCYKGWEDFLAALDGAPAPATESELEMSRLTKETIINICM